MKYYSYKIKILVIMSLFVFCITQTGCSRDGSRVSGGHSRSEHQEHGSNTTHRAHGHDVLSDLDRSVEDLFAASCEHDMKAHECDDCRYEVGVVKAGAELFNKGLLERTKAKYRSLTKPMELNGEVAFDNARVANISSQIAGVIKRAHVAIGDQVVKYNSLVTIESTALGDAQADFLESKVILETAEINYDRLSTLRRKGISSGKELLAAKKMRDSARVRRDAAFSNLINLGMNSASIRRLDKTGTKGRITLRAPFKGTILQMNASLGELVRPEKNLVTVVDNSVVWVWVDVYERDIAAVTRKQAMETLVADVVVKAFPDRKLKGTVDFVSPSLNKSARTAAVRIIVPNPDGRLMSGMFAGVKIHMPEDDEVLSVPSAAVLDDDGRYFVFVHHKEDNYIRRPVTPGRKFADLTEIKSGLTGQETIVAKGAFLLKSDVLRSKMGAGCAD